MAHFYATLDPARSVVTRTGTKSSGISAHIRGWDFGVKVHVWFCDDTEQDMVTINLTSGSNGWRTRELGTFMAKDLFINDLKVVSDD